MKEQLKEIKIEVTHKCLLNCIHCSSGSSSINNLEICWYDCKRIIREAAEMGVETIVFSGGEPLLWEDIDKAVKETFRLGMRPIIYTSGVVVDRPFIISRLEDLGVDTFIFALYGQKTIHDLITRVSGSWKRLMNSVFKVSVNKEFHFVPFPSTYLELDNLVSFIGVFGNTRVSVLRLVPHGRATHSRNLILSVDQAKELKNLIENLTIAGNDIRTGSPFNFLGINENPVCLAATDRLTISPDLTIHPCDAFKHLNHLSLGVRDSGPRLNDTSLKRCWTLSPFLSWVREFAKTISERACSGCLNFLNCGSGCLAQKLLDGRRASDPDPMCLLGRI
jgi:radical SAM protein with 4Fe4S-binding SPASM domain